MKANADIGYNSDQPGSNTSSLATSPAIRGLVSSHANSSEATPNRLTVKKQTTELLNNKDSDNCTRVLTQVFGHDKFKGKQREIVEAAYGGSDVLVVAPTGMGKSLCFQIPAIADKAWTNR
ncbi:hypothetical protein BDZ97DRAFT_1926016 [Flammula alnicola]|nr:hypothetical protein BDZ97DRAFT_1926016 [Flammula alnicola]